MTIFRQPVWSRLGAAFGVLAVLALALAAPIFHVHVIERDFAGVAHAGHSGPAASHMGHAGHGQDEAPARPGTATVHCPLCMLGKMAGLLLPPNLPVIHVPSLVRDAPFPVETIAAVSSQSQGIAQPRGPPARA
jgi:hypothetical protein